MRNRFLAALGVVAVLAVTLTACHGSGSTTSLPTSFTPAASPLVSSTAGQYAQALYEKCVPADALGQVKLAHQLLTDTKAHPNGAWAALLKCAGVDSQNEPAIKDQALTAAEHVKWTDKTAREDYFATTLPKIITQYANIPGVSASASSSSSAATP